METNAHSSPEAHLGGFDSVARYDAETGERQVWGFGGERFVGEPVFAPDPSSSDEADGWLLALAYDREATLAELHVFEGSRVGDGPMAVVRMLSRLQMPPEVLARVNPKPQRAPAAGPPDVVFYTGCNVLKTPHIALLCLDVLDLLDVDYRVMGGTSTCCGTT